MSDADYDTKRNGAPAANISKQRRRKKGGSAKNRSSSSSSSNSWWWWCPTDIVCTDRDVKKSKKSTELALLLGVTVVCLYLFGLFELMQSMPELSARLRHYHVGGNLNLAKMEMGSVVISSHPRSDDEEDGESYSDSQDGESDSDEEDGENYSDSQDGESDSDSEDGEASDSDSEEDVEEIPRNKPNHDGTNNNNNQSNNNNNAEPPSVQAQHHGISRGGDDIPIPVGTWPVSVRHEELETMVHVGDLKTIMEVPKFWSPPVHNHQPFTREQAMQIGTCAKADPSTGSHVRGEDCPMLERTIFIGIASYRDYQCRQTLETAFRRAANPNRIRVGVVDQIVVGEDVACNEPMKPCEDDPEQALCKYKDQVDVYTMDAPLSVGPVFARHLGYRLYRGEYYATQSDAHVSFTTNWDTDIIHQLESTHDEMAVLSTYLTDVQGSIDDNGNSLRNTRPIMCNTYYEGGPQGLHLRHGSQPERQPSIHGVPQLQPWWAAGYSFSRGHFLVNVPYDYLQSMIFQGEEMSIGIRGFTVGYDFYAPERSVCFHHYATGKNAKVRGKVKHFWENGNRYAGTGKAAMKRLLGIVHMNPETDPSEWDHVDIDRYGLGGVRTPEQFYKTFGIDVVKKKTQGHLCEFVMDGAAMHKLFTPNLRADGMGIDYSKIDYQWVDPHPEGNRDETA